MRRVWWIALLVLAVALALWTPRLSRELHAESKAPLKLKIGDVAPDFTLKDQSGKDVSLHDFRGKKSVALAFYVFAFTGG